MERTVTIMVTREQARLIEEHVEWMTAELESAVAGLIRRETAEFARHLIFGTPQEQEPTGMLGHGLQ